MKPILHVLDGREKYITETERVLQPLPHRDFRFASPFILLHHGGPDTVPPGSDNRIHPHPHRGFAPVSFLVQGQFHHKDSTGNDQVLDAGDVQWMFAGKGILHSEGPSAAIHASGGVVEMVQLWINVPAAYKWDEPRYQYVPRADMPEVLAADGVHMRLVSGELDGTTGPVKVNHTPIVSAIGTIAQGRHVDIAVTSGYWTMLYIIGGAVTIDGSTAVGKHHLVVFDKQGDSFRVLADEDATILLLSGEPIDEPVAAKDNFVMSTMEEADQAIEDYRNGMFGTLDY